MNYCFIISNSRLDYFNIEKVMKEYNHPVHFVLIHSKQAFSRISEKFKKAMEFIFELEVVDFANCKDIMKKFLEKKFDHSIVCTDEPYLTIAAELREYFNIQGAKSYEYIPFNSKITMKQYASAKNIRVPRFINLDILSAQKNLIEYHDIIYKLFNGPYIVKPINCGACELTAKISCAEDFIRWSQISLKAEVQYTAEEFIAGNLYHCDSFVVDQKVLFFDLCQCTSPCLDFLSGKALGSYSIANSQFFEMISQYNQRIIDALQPPDGALHLEFMMGNDNQPVFIEIGARPPGKYVCLMQEKNYGINLYELTLRHALKMSLDIEMKRNFYNAWIMFPISPGVVKELKVPEVKSKMSWEWKIKVGDSFLHAPSSINEGIAAESILYNESYEELMEDISLLRNHQACLCQ